MKRKMLSLFLILALLLGILPVSIFAEDAVPETTIPLYEKGGEAELPAEEVPLDIAEPVFTDESEVPEAVYDEDTVTLAATLSNPVTVLDDQSASGQTVTWDCIYYGSFPQAEIVDSVTRMDSALSAAQRKDGDFIVDATLYAKLQSASGWSNNTITINGEKYLRMKQSNAVTVGTNGYYYNWTDSTTYHYFKYQPIRWRVLSTDGSTALLLADVGLDAQSYSPSACSTWKISTIRSYLNGYDSTYNDFGMDYSNAGFLQNAFSASERAYIVKSGLENNLPGEVTQSTGARTSDYVFLLSYAEAMYAPFGFVNVQNKQDPARWAGSSAYARARGVWGVISGATVGNCYWWLRSAADDNAHAGAVYATGTVGKSTSTVADNAVRPVIRIKLSGASYTYAGTVSSNGSYSAAGEKPAYGNPVQGLESASPSGLKTTWSCAWFGSYPQAEVVSSKTMMTNAVGEAYLQSNDYIVDATLYAKLQTSTGWKNNELTLGGAKYCRMKRSDALVQVDGNSSYYGWSDSTTYHYFKYQPIKWRVLSTDGTTALLIADSILDDQTYQQPLNEASWGGCTLRSWLNGYNGDNNVSGTDFRGSSFYSTAFSAAEQAGILQTTLQNNTTANNEEGSGTPTTDRVFLLSKTECSKSGYGFYTNPNYGDWARKCRATVYAKARGIYWYPSGEYMGSSLWWLRASGSVVKKALCINYVGMLNEYSIDNDLGVRPAIRVSLAATGLSPAGTVSSNGTKAEIAPPVTYVTPDNPFADVAADQYYYKPVLWAVANGITAGTSNTTFSPDATCTRAQVVTFLWRLAGKPDPTTKKNPFSDVKASEYYYKAVLWAVEKNITAGTSGTTFSPDANCTRAQVVTFLWRYKGRVEPSTTSNPFKDVSSKEYYYKPVLWAVEKNITAGTSSTTFSPDANCTRAQVVTFLWRAEGRPEP